MSHECDGDCRTTAEWRQTQIRDLTERAEKAEAAVKFKQGLIEDISRDCENAESKLARMADELLNLCDDQWLRRRDRYMGMGERLPHDTGAGATEFCAHQVRSILKRNGHESGTSGYLDWMRAGRPHEDAS